MNSQAEEGESMSDITPNGVQNDVPVVEIRGGLLGFPEFTQFSLIKINDEGLVYRLQSLEDAAINFVVVPAASFFPNYARNLISFTCIINIAAKSTLHTAKFVIST